MTSGVFSYFSPTRLRVACACVALIAGTATYARAQVAPQPIPAVSPGSPCPTVTTANVAPGQSEAAVVSPLALHTIAFNESPTSFHLVLNRAASVTLDGKSYPSQVETTVPALAAQPIHVLQLDGNPACTYYIIGFGGWSPSLTADGSALTLQSEFGTVTFAFTAAGSMNVVTDIGNSAAWHVRVSGSGQLLPSGIVTGYGIDAASIDSGNVPIQNIVTARIATPFALSSDICGTVQRALVGVDAKVGIYTNSISTIDVSHFTVDCATGTAQATVALALRYFGNAPLKGTIAFRSTGNNPITLTAAPSSVIPVGTVVGSPVGIHVTEIDLPDQSNPLLRVAGVMNFNGVSQTQQIFTLLVSDAGVTISSGSISLPIANSSASITLTNLNCTLAMSGVCAGTLTVAATGLPQLSLDFANGKITGSAQFPLTPVYSLTLSSINLNLATQTISASATLSGGLVSSGQVTIPSLTIALPTPKQNLNISAPKISLTGAYSIGNLLQIKNLTGSVTTNSGVIRFSLTLDGSASFGDFISATDKFPGFTVAFTGAQLTIPFAGKTSFVVPASGVTASGLLLGRQISGGCPASATVAATPLIDIAGDVYTFCLGVHLAPGTGNTGDIVNLAVSLKGPQPKPAPEAAIQMSPAEAKLRALLPAPAPYATDHSGLVVQSVRIYADSTDAVKMRVGTRQVSITKLDVSYDGLNPSASVSDYASGRGIACNEALQGTVDLSVTSIIGGAVPATGGAAGASTPAATDMNADIGVGTNCMFADFDGSVHVDLGPTTNFMVTAMHFGRAPFANASPSPKAAAPAPPVVYNTYMSVNGNLYVGQAAVVVKNVGFYTIPSGKVKVSGSIDPANTLAQNLPLLVSNLFTALVGIFGHHG